MTKTLAEIEKGLSVDYSGPTFEKGGNTYIPWNEAVKVANDVFGIDGYTVEVRETHLEAIPNAKGQVTYGYAATVRVTVHTAEGGSFYRDGVGFNEMEFTNEREYTGKDGNLVNVPARAMIDTAIKGAASDGANRAFKLFGPAFGLKLYDKVPSSQQNTGASRASGQSGDRRPSEKQMAVLEKNGYGQEQVDGLSFSQWKAVIDAIFAHETPPIAPAAKQAAAKNAAPKTTKPVKAAADEEYDIEPDEIPF